MFSGILCCSGGSSPGGCLGGLSRCGPRDAAGACSGITTGQKQMLGLTALSGFMHIKLTRICPPLYQTSSLLLLNESSAPPPEVSEELKTFI